MHTDRRTRETGSGLGELVGWGGRSVDGKEGQCLCSVFNNLLNYLKHSINIYFERKN